MTARLFATRPLVVAALHLPDFARTRHSVAWLEDYAVANARLFAQAGVIVVTAFISPYRADRDRARQAAPDAFHEIHVAADLATCEGRDPKGLYKRARAGEIGEFTGVSAPYEAPDAPELVVDTARDGIDDCVDRIVAYVETYLAARPLAMTA